MELTWRVINTGVGGGKGGKVQRISSINDRWKIDFQEVEGAHRVPKKLDTKAHHNYITQD